VSLALRLRGLDTAISKTVLGDDPARASRGGWFLRAADPDPLDDLPDLKAVYDRCSGEEGGYAGRCTAPLLIDLATETIVSSESADIVRILNSFTTDSAADSNNGRDLYPVELGREIDEANAWVYEQVNNGVYKAGFATKQAAYEAAEREVHAGLARCDSVLGLSRFICGEAVTEADVRLLPTAVRFDAIYAALFRCGRKIIRADYPHVDRWMREMVELAGPGLFDLQAAKTSYYSNLFPLNPGGIVPVGPSAADLGL
jgi:putative glutathione S-transferase